MKETTQKFLNLFFNPGEDICFSHNKYAVPSRSQQEINENNTVLVAINPIKGTRSDDNVTCFRTFMIECDDMPIEEQRKYVDEMGFPYSYCCFSGGKSLHFACVLDHEVPSEEIYRYTYQWILNILEKADQKTKNPSRSIRFPGVTRPETGKEQELVYIGERISLQTLSNWLNSHLDKKPEPLAKKFKNNGEPNFEGIGTWAVYALGNGVHNMEGSRNQTWMAIGCEMAINGFDLDYTLSKLENYFHEQKDFKKREWQTAVKSGWNFADKISRKE